MTFHRYVALGDSFTEGVGDPDPARPNGLRGWADRVAEVLATQTDDFGYANLAVRGRKLGPIVAEQLDAAVALEPVTVDPPPVLARRQQWAANAQWTREFLVPWVHRRLTGRSSGDTVSPKRPDLSRFR